MRVAFVSAFVMAIGCASSDEGGGGGDESDIRTGTLANAEHKEVGVYTFSNGGYCTATLIGPRTAITAGHCVLPASGAGSCSGGTLYLDTVGDGVFQNRIAVKVRACATPLANVNSLSVRSQDIAVLALERAVTEVSDVATLASQAPASDAKVTVFGYGRFGATCAESTQFQKYRATTTFGATTSATCRGDSGGPFFKGDGRSSTREIVALVSGQTTRQGQEVLADPIANRAWILARKAESEAGRALTDAR